MNKHVNAVEIDDVLLTEREVKKEFSIAVGALRRWRDEDRGCGPPVTTIGRLKRYKRGSVKEWLKSQENNKATIRILETDFHNIESLITRVTARIVVRRIKGAELSAVKSPDDLGFLKNLKLRMMRSPDGLPSLGEAERVRDALPSEMFSIRMNATQASESAAL